MKKSNYGASVIGGADGPTGIFTADKRSLKQRLRTSFYNFRCRSAEKKIVPGTHTLDALVQYARERYGLTEVEPSQENYGQQRNDLKECLILQHKPEILGEWKDIPRPDVSSAPALRAYLGKIGARSKMIAELPEDVLPMDFHMYEIKIGTDCLEMSIDYIWNIFDISYSGNKKAMKRFRKIAKDLYLYYGVSQEDIQKKTERYVSLVTTLSL